MSNPIEINGDYFNPFKPDWDSLTDAKETAWTFQVLQTKNIKKLVTRKLYR